MTGSKSILEAYRARPYRNIFFALIVVTLVDALAPGVFAKGRFSDLMLAVILTAALVETVRSRRSAIWALVLGLPAILLRLVAAFTDDSPVMNTTVLTVTAMFFAFLIWNLLHDLGRGDRPTSERIFGALCAYLFIGLLFALIYTHVEYRHPGSFAMSNPVIAEEGSAESNLVPTFTYYSFVTLTTLGYGDITPVAGHARTLAWLEALLGQLYLAVMVAGFVAVHISESMKKDRRDPPSDR
jgi:hypothetical protein